MNKKEAIQVVHQMHQQMRATIQEHQVMSQAIAYLDSLEEKTEDKE